MIDWDDRQMLAMPEEMEILKVVAEQLGNIRSRKPARLVYLYTLGKDKGEIIADLRVSETTLNTWFERWIDHGIYGLTGLDIVITKEGANG